MSPPAQIHPGCAANPNRVLASREGVSDQGQGGEARVTLTKTSVAEPRHARALAYLLLRTTMGTNICIHG